MKASNPASIRRKWEKNVFQLIHFIKTSNNLWVILITFSTESKLCWNVNVCNKKYKKTNLCQWGDISCQFLPPGDNFTNILWAAFAPKSFRQKITNPNCKYIKDAQRTLVWKAAHKILVKLTVIPKLFARLLCAYNLGL